jgi:hypothetical protein
MEIKGKFCANIDEIHKEFLEKYFKEFQDTNEKDEYLIREVFKFIKMKI